MRYQPQGRARINQSHPLASRLVFAFIPGLGDITRRHTPANAHQTALSRFGRSTLPLNAAPYPTYGTRDSKSSGSFSVAIIGDFAAPGSFTAPLLAHTTGAANGWKFGIASNGAAAFTSYGVVDYVGTTAISGTSGILSMTATPGGPLRIFTNGVFRESIAIGTVIASVGASFTIGNRISANDSMSASRVSLALYFDGGLSDDEHRLVAINPWALIEDDDEDYIPISSGLSSVGVDLSPSYAIMAAVGKDLASSYNIRAAVSKDLIPSYNIRAAVGRDLAPSYNIRAAVGRDFNVEYSIGSVVNVTIDANLIPRNRWINFEGTLRVVQFPGTARVVTFEGTNRIVEF